jgi:hypothetical protein
MGVLTVVVVKIKLIGQERWKVPASSRRVRNEGANKWEVLARWKSRAGLLWRWLTGILHSSVILIL